MGNDPTPNQPTKLCANVEKPIQEPNCSTERALVVNQIIR